MLGKGKLTLEQENHIVAIFQLIKENHSGIIKGIKKTYSNFTCVL
jgi:hypothetical protein